jgi:hypothetical protein
VVLFITDNKQILNQIYSCMIGLVSENFDKLLCLEHSILSTYVKLCCFHLFQHVLFLELSKYKMFLMLVLKFNLVDSLANAIGLMIFLLCATYSVFD